MVCLHGSRIRYLVLEWCFYHQVNISYLNETTAVFSFKYITVFASVLAAVPFLGTYWCSIPAFLDLWLIQDRFTLGIVLLLIHVLFPTSFVDPAIYADVKG